MPINNDFIRGNENLPKPHTPHMVDEATQKKYIDELYRCKHDIIYFAEKYFTIISPAKGKHLIQLYGKQKELILSMVNNNRVISLASRQTGKTTSYTIFALHKTMFYPEEKVLIAANKKDTALEILSRIQMAYECLPNWLKPGVLDYNKGNIRFSNNSAIQGVATGSSSARGFSAGCLILDEFAWIFPPSVVTQFWNSVYPVVSSSKKSKVIVVSTPNGVGNLYHTLWEKAIKKTKDDEGEKWTPIRIDWWDVPGRDEQWKKTQIEAIGYTSFAQEFGNSFLASSTPKLISDTIIQKYRMFIDEHQDIGQDITLDLYKGKSFKYKIYHEHQDNRAYLLSFDVGDGVGKDSSVAYVWDVTDLTNIIMVAKYSDNLTSTSEFAYIINHIWRQFGRCWIAGEANSIGRGVFDLLQNLYNVDTFVSMNKGKVGILSHAQIKSKACRFTKYLLDLQSVNVVIYDPQLIDDMEFFAQKNTVKHVLYEAMNGKHDDHIMAFIWALYTLNEKDIENYFTVHKYMSTELGGTVPLFIQSILHPSQLNTDTMCILDDAWRKEKNKINKYVERHDRKEALKLPDYFDRKSTQTGVLGMLERADLYDDGNDGGGFFMP